MIGQYDQGDDSCGAAPGVMGWHSCRKYPGCGCGGSPDPTPVETHRQWGQRAVPEYKSFERQSDWHIRTFHKIETIQKGFYRIWLDKNQYAENSRYFPCKVDGNKLIFHKTVIQNNLKEFFEVKSTNGAKL